MHAIELYWTKCPLNSSGAAHSAFGAKPLGRARVGTLSGAFLGLCLWQSSFHNLSGRRNLLEQDLELRCVVRQGERLEFLLPLP